MEIIAFFEDDKQRGNAKGKNGIVSHCFQKKQRMGIWRDEEIQGNTKGNIGKDSKKGLIRYIM